MKKVVKTIAYKTGTEQTLYQVKAMVNELRRWTLDVINTVVNFVDAVVIWPINKLTKKILAFNKKNHYFPIVILSIISFVALIYKSTQPGFFITAQQLITGMGITAVIIIGILYAIDPVSSKAKKRKL